MTDDEAMLEDCEKRESKLSDWERIFLESIGRQLGAEKGLTLKQQQRLEQIWERVTE